MAIFPSSAIPSAADTGYTIDQSLRFNDDDSAYLNWTAGTATNRKIWTYSCWVKRNEIGTGESNRSILFEAISAGGASSVLIFLFNDDKLQLYDIKVSAPDYGVITSSVFRDTSAWYHIVLAVDSTQSTDTNRIKLYVNGVNEPLTDQYGLFPLNYESNVNDAIQHNIGKYTDISGYTDLYLAEAHFIDGTALTPTSFGESGDYGEWKPIEVTGLTYGTNGFYLDFSDSAALGDDAAGSNDWTVNNLTAADQMLDTPTNNFATLNPLNNNNGTLAEGNCRGLYGSTDTSIGVTFAVTHKCYFEFISDTTGREFGLGIHDSSYLMANWEGNDDKGYGIVMVSGAAAQKNELGTTASFGSVPSTTDIVQIAFDPDAGKIWAGINNTWHSSGNPATGTNPMSSSISTSVDWVPFITFSSTGGNCEGTLNFGQDSSFAGLKTAQGNQDGNGIGDFYYTPPSGFLALCTSNLPEPAVTPSEHFNTVTYSGDGGSQTITSENEFQTDLVWVKGRNSTNGHHLFDAVRGFGSAKSLSSNSTQGEGAYDASYGYISSPTSTGFTASAGSGGSQYVNDASYTYVAWNWKANGAGSANTDGDMAETVTVSANTDAGFSIVTYTGDGSAATVGHGLSKAPEMVIVKRRDATYDPSWLIYHSGNTAAPETDYLKLNDNAATADDATVWNDTAPTVDVFNLGTHASVNGDDSTYVAYCFHSVDGYSKMGSYTGNGDADGTFVYTGFRPAFVIFKRTDATSEWRLFDSEREIYNVMDYPLRPNSSGAEANTAGSYDFVSNGIKARGVHNDANTSGATYIYLAFAETPFKYSNAR